MGLFYIVMIFGVNALAANHDGGCQSLTTTQMKLSVHASNIMNVDSTRTRHGGHYKKRTLLCGNQGCEVKESRDRKVVYEPGHPDANRSGYVTYPDIDILKEYAQLISAAAELKDLAFNKVCQSQILQSAEDMLVKYHGSKIISDNFKFKGSKLLSWGRTYTSGKREVFDLNTRVEQKRFATNSLAF